MSYGLARRAFDRTARVAYVGIRDLTIALVERRQGISTMAELDLESVGAAGEHRTRYKPTEWRTLGRILPEHDVGPDDVFIDFGSGMGRVVFQAALRYSCRRVVGVEVSEQLNAVAVRNIERNRGRLRCRHVELVTADALDYLIPDDVTIAFFANPFTGPVFASVVSRLFASVDAHPRRLRIVYRNPVEREFLLATGRVQLIRRLPGLRPSRQWSRESSTEMYEVLPLRH